MNEEIRNKLTSLKINTAKGEEAYGDAYEEKLKQFQERWIPLEKAYFDAYGIREKSDLTVFAG